jgi:hypothetical protein
VAVAAGVGGDVVFERFQLGDQPFGRSFRDRGVGSRTIRLSRIAFAAVIEGEKG